MSRTARTYAAYVPSSCDAHGDEVTFRTAGNYEYAGLVLPLDGSGQWRVVAKGWSQVSVASRTRTLAGRLLDAQNPLVKWKLNRYSGVAQMWETTAPVVAKYFGHHRVNITAVYREDTGWEKVNYHAGKSLLRRLAKEGVAGVQFWGQGSMWRLSERRGVHTPDFTMAELLKSMNKRSA